MILRHALLRQSDAKVFKKYSQMKLQMKREALCKLNRSASEASRDYVTIQPELSVLLQFSDSLALLDRRGDG